MTPTPTRPGASSGSACLASGRSTRWSGRCAAISSGSSTSSRRSWQNLKPRSSATMGTVAQRRTRSRLPRRPSESLPPLSPCQLPCGPRRCSPPQVSFAPRRSQTHTRPQIPPFPPPHSDSSSPISSEPRTPPSPDVRAARSAHAAPQIRLSMSTLLMNASGPREHFRLCQRR